MSDGNQEKGRSAMGLDLFGIPKIGLFIDNFTPGTDTVAGETIKTMTVSLRLQPFTVEHAKAIDDGLGINEVRQQLFNLTDAKPKDIVEGEGLRLRYPKLKRQTLTCYPSPDSDESRTKFAEVKCEGFHVKRYKDTDGFVLTFRATFGPVGPDDLAFLLAHYCCQTFITFHEAAPGLFDDEAEAEAKKKPRVKASTPLLDSEAGTDQDRGGDGSWDEEAGDPLEDAVAASGAVDDDRDDKVVPILKKRGTKKRGKADPEAERVEQVKAGRARGARA